MQATIKVPINARYIKGQALLLIGEYRDGTPAIQGVDPETEEPLFTASVRLGEPPSDGCLWLKGWSENEGIPESLVAAGVVKLTGRTGPTGFCEAVEARLLEIAPD
jgi:hypothetical protein